MRGEPAEERPRTVAGEPPPGELSREAARRPNRATARRCRGRRSGASSRSVRSSATSDEGLEQAPVRGAVLAEAGGGLRDGALEHSRRAVVERTGRAAPASGSTPGRAPRAAASAGTASRPPADASPSRRRGGSPAASARRCAARRRACRRPRSPASKGRPREHDRRGQPVRAGADDDGVGHRPSVLSGLSGGRRLVNHGDQRVDHGRVELRARQGRSSATAASTGRAMRYGRSVVIALNASQQATIRATRGMFSPASPSGYPCRRSARGASGRSSRRGRAGRRPERAAARPRGVGLDEGALLRVERSRLVDELVGDADLADVVEQRGELRVRGGSRGRRRAPRATASDETDDVAAVRAGVGVVGLDDVAEQERGARGMHGRARGPGRCRPAVRGRSTASRPTSGRTTSRRGRAGDAGHQGDRRSRRGERRTSARPSTMKRRCDRGRRRTRSTREPPSTAKSTPNCAASAARNSGHVRARTGLAGDHQDDRGPEGVPRVPREDGDPRPAGASRRSSAPSTNPATDAAGTRTSGRVKSIGTSSSWVGTAIPSPTSNSTRETTA